MTLDVDDENLVWIWAYREQVRQLDATDAVFLQRSSRKNGFVWDDAARSTFLDAYRLKRGKYGKEAGREEIWNALERVYTSGHPQEPPELAMMWSDAIGVIQEIMRSRQDDPPELKSLSAKLMWFYHPEHMTMYDRLACKGLVAWLKDGAHSGRVQEPLDYLKAFEEFYLASKGSILTAENCSDRMHPYHRRVADKRLWLRGSGKERQVLFNYRESLKLFPFRK